MNRELKKGNDKRNTNRLPIESSEMALWEWGSYLMECKPVKISCIDISLYNFYI